MVLKFVETAMLSSSDEADAIAILNDFLSRYVWHTIIWTLFQYKNYGFTMRRFGMNC